MRKTASVLLAVSFMLMPVLNASAQVSEITTSNVGSNEKISSSSKIAGNFEDDCVILVMTNEASLSQLHYSTSDFSEIECKSITNLSPAMTSKVELQLSKNTEISSRSSSDDASLSITDAVDLRTFNQILYLELEEAGKENVLEAIQLLEQRSDVLCAGPNYIYTIEPESDCFTTDNCENLNTNPMRTVTTGDPLISQQWAIDKMTLAYAWQLSNGSSRQVTVGVIDHGIDVEHPDLDDRINQTKSTTIYFQEDGISNLSPSSDDIGHGTLVAGIIGANSDNGEGIHGINSNVDIVSIRVDTTNNQLHTKTLARAIDYARSQGVEILSISLQVKIEQDTEYCESKICTLDDICIYHIVKKFSGLIVCSAGNSYDNIDNTDPLFPASLDLNNIIVVGASTPSDTMWIGDLTDNDPKNDGTNYGRYSVDLFAPGVNICTTIPSHFCSRTNCPSSESHVDYLYHYRTGTSFAAPQVAGVASLLLSMYPDQVMNYSALRYHILDGVDICDSFRGKCATGGRINAFKVLSSHVMDFYYEQYDSMYHQSFCECTGWMFEGHSFSDIGGMEVCLTCGYYLA